MLPRFARAFSSTPRHVGVVGAGQMATGIAIVAARHTEARVSVFGYDDAELQRFHKFVGGWASKEHAKGRMGEQEAAQFPKRFDASVWSSASTPEALKTVDFSIEAVTENLDLKGQIYRTLDAHASPEAVLATNTSSISITKIAAFTKRPEQVIGMHFMNPVPVMKGLELIRGLATSDATMAATKALGLALQKEPTVCQKDVPGFIVNRILMPMINEAVFALYEGIATAEDIDLSMKVGTGVPMGPLTLADFIGLDTCLFIMNVLHKETGDSKYRPCTLLTTYVDAGWLGKKTGRGFYKY